MNYKITITSSSPNSLNTYIKYLKLLLKNWNIEAQIFYLPTTKKKTTLLKSPHESKKAKEHFEIRTARRMLQFQSSLGIERIHTLLANKPSGVNLKFNY